jgi:hypothetical protein
LIESNCQRGYLVCVLKRLGPGSAGFTGKHPLRLSIQRLNRI